MEKTYKELSQTKAELISTKSIEEAEKCIDKTHGSIYYEKLPNGNSRTICGFCWEKEHIRIPIITQISYHEDTKIPYNCGYCHSCKTSCIEDIEIEIPETKQSLDSADNELPF